MQRFAIIVTVVLALGGPSLERGRTAGGAPASIRQLTQQSDAVVVARLAGGFATPTNALLWLEIEQTFKGSVKPGQVIAVSWMPSKPSVAGPEGGAVVDPDTGLFFLKDSAAAAWELVPAAYGWIGSLRGAYYPVPQKSDRGAAPAGDEPAEKALLLLLDAREAGAMRPDSPQVSWADELRLAGKRPAVRQAVDRLAGSLNENLSSLAVSAKIARGDLDALTALAEGTVPRTKAIVIQALSYRFASHDPRAVDMLVRIATTKDRDLELRRSAAVALIRSQTPVALPAFARLLDEEDLHLQASGIGGLSHFANNISSETHHPEPGAWPYRTDETMAHAAIEPRKIATNPFVYVSFWKGWWESNKQKIISSNSGR